MSAAQGLLRSYSIASRKRIRKSARTEAKHVPAGLFTRNHALPMRKQLLFLESRVERVNGRVLARCFSISRAGSVLFNSSMLLSSQPSMLKHALEGMLRSSGSVTTKWAADATAGLVKDVLGETAEHLHKCASQDVSNVAQVGGTIIIDWLSKMDKALLARLAAYSAVVDTPVHQYWEDFLDNVIMPSNPNSPVAVAMKVLLDQGLMAPMATAFMIFVFKILEGKKEEVSADFHQQLLERLVPDWAVWPMARVIEFTLVPQESRPLFEGMVGLFSFGLGMYKLRQKLATKMKSVPRSIKEATSQGLEASMEDENIEPKRATSPFAMSSWEAYVKHNVHARPAKSSPLGRSSTPFRSTTHDEDAEEEDGAHMSHRWKSEPVRPARPSDAEVSSSATLSDMFTGSMGLAVAAAALRNSGIMDSPSPPRPHQQPTVKVNGLVPTVQNLHSPFSALAHEPLRSSADHLVVADSGGGRVEESRSLSGVGSFDMECWRGVKGRASRLAVVSAGNR